jgi:hypothetical protein
MSTCMRNANDSLTRLNKQRKEEIKKSMNKLH